MSDAFAYRFFERSGMTKTANYLEVTELAREVKLVLQRSEIIAAIQDAHTFGASSHAIQSVILEPMKSLGFLSERKGLFEEMNVAGIRPDYFRPILGGGVIFEVERGKTIANNMDLLDVWKTHICKEAKHLFLLVPRIRITKKGSEQRIFFSVEKRIGTFFLEQTMPIDVDTVHLFGY